MEKNDKNLAETKRKLRTEEQEIESMKETWKQRIQEYDEKLTILEKTEKDLQVQAKEEFLRFRMEFESKFEDEKRKMMIEKVELEGLRRGLDSERLRGGQDEIENFDFELQKLRTENRVLKEQNASQAQAVNQLRTELKLIAETQNHLISQIGIKENANKVLQTELETYKTLSTELRENLNKMKNSHENEKRKLIEEVEGFKGSHLVHDFLIDKKYNWSKIYQEENQIKQEFFDLIKPSVHLYPQNQSKAATSEVPLKQQPNVKTYVNEFEYDSSSSKD
jgi:chromosome segregation ATPase